MKEEDSDNGDADCPPLTGRSATSAVNNSQASSYLPGITYHSNTFYSFYNLIDIALAFIHFFFDFLNSFSFFSVL